MDKSIFWIILGATAAVITVICIAGAFVVRRQYRKLNYLTVTVNGGVSLNDKSSGISRRLTDYRDGLLPTTFSASTAVRYKIILRCIGYNQEYSAYITSSVSVGRECGGSDEAIRIDDGKLSRQHCRFILYDNGDIYLKDLNSTNNTFLNDCKLISETKVKNGDVIKIGSFSYEYICEQA